VRGLTGDEGKVGEKIQELTAVTGVAGVEEEKGRGGVSTVNRGGDGAPRGVDGVPVARVLEGGEEAAWKLLRDDVVLMVPLAEAEGRCSVGSMVRPSGGGA
jgi:hypothetical protein